MTDLLAPPPAAPPAAPAAAAPEPEADAEDPGRPVNALQSLAKKLRDKAGKFVVAETPPGDTPKPADDQPQDKPPAEDKPPAKAPEQPPEQPPEPPAAAADNAEVKLGRARIDLRKAQQDAITHKTRADTVAKELETLKATAAKNPFRHLEQVTGRKFEELLKDAAAGKYDDSHALPDHVQQQLDEIAAWKKEQQEAQEQQRSAAGRTKDLATVKAFLDSRADDFPALAAGDWGTEDLLDRALDHLKKTGEQPDLAALASEMESGGFERLQPIMLSPRVLAKLAKNPDARKAVLEAFGLSEKQTATLPASSSQGARATGDGPRTLTNQVTQEVPPSTRELTPDEEEAERLDRFRRFKQGGRIIGR